MQTVLHRYQWLVLAGFILLCLATGSVGGFATQGSIDTWYRTLAKPSWNGPAIVLFGVQLALNLGWSLLFFGARSPGLALVEVVFLWTGVLLTMLAFFGRSLAAGWLFVPYLAWVSFAAVLNLAIWMLN